MAALTAVATSDSVAAASYSSAAEWRQKIQWWCRLVVTVSASSVSVATISLWHASQCSGIAGFNVGSGSIVFLGGMDGICCHKKI